MTSLRNRIFKLGRQKLQFNVHLYDVVKKRPDTYKEAEAFIDYPWQMERCCRELLAGIKSANLPKQVNVMIVQITLKRIA